jgi:hypothetical protein
MKGHGAKAISMWCLQAVAVHNLADTWIAPETFAMVTAPWQDYHNT